MTESLEETFEPVELSTLRAGMLVDRPLYVYLATNARYVRLVHAFHPLEDGQLKKLLAFGKAFSPARAIEQRFPQLEAAALETRRLCESDELPPYELHRLIRAQTEWLLESVCRDPASADDVVFFCQKAFGSPCEATLQAVSDFSVSEYDLGLRAGAVAGLLALWLGWSDRGLVTQLIEAVFSRESRRDGVATFLPLDERIARLSSGDELAEIADVARLLVLRRGDSGLLSLAGSHRVARKLIRQFKLDAPEKARVAA